MTSDYYKILNVKTNASHSEIKAAYKKLALVHHPDRNSGRKESEETFKTINEAYKTLSNTGKRRAYDQKFLFNKGPKIDYSYHQGGFYRSILKQDVAKQPIFNKPEVFKSKKKDVDFYLFWAALSLIFILIIIFLLSSV